MDNKLALQLHTGIRVFNNVPKDEAADLQVLVKDLSSTLEPI